MDMKLAVFVLPVSDVDRAKRFYRLAGFREDIDYASGDDFRVVQFTPPGPKPPSSLARGSPPRPQARHEDSIWS